jgi:PTH1 family peptidyl-tRNA hydrolase
VNLRFSRAATLTASRLVVGLGNPGREYAGTRHNVGFRVVDGLAAAHGIALRTRRLKAVYGVGEIGAQRVCLAKPQTYMNLSGQAVAALMRELSLPHEDLLVVCDDVNLPIGRLRIRRSGSAGGSGGLKSIIASLGSEAFPRVRVGVGRPGSGGLVDHVLGPFTRAELPLIEQAIAAAVEAVQLSLTDDLDAAMNRFNALDFAAPPGSQMD